MIRSSIFLLISIFLLSYPLYPQDKAAMEKMYSEADAFFQSGKLKESEDVYKTIISLEPDSAEAYNNLGLIESMDDGRIKDSILHFMKAIKLKPGYADAFNNLGVICYKIGQMDRAEQYIKKSIELDPGNAKNYFSLGWVYASGKKEYNKAIEALKRSIELDKNQPDAYYILGMAYVHLGRKLDVMDQITNLRSINKENLAEALENLIRVPSPKDMKSFSPEKAGKDVKMTYDVTMVKSKEDATPEFKKTGPSVKMKLKVPTAPQKYKITGPTTPETKRHARIKGTTGQSTGTGKIESGRIQLKLTGGTQTGTSSQSQ